MIPTRAAESGSPRWLDDEQQVAWRAFNSMMIKLRWALECQLQRGSGLSFIEYHALAMLSEQPAHTIRMSELAQLTNASLSRLSHLIKRLEQRELVRREPDPDDGRFTNAILTPAGLCLLAASAPAHVAKVRELVIDALSPAELRQLSTASGRILERVESDADLAHPALLAIHRSRLSAHSGGGRLRC
jgi:DNA-binding MarR family transcriptional regulator